jgi:hypothetical protein
MGKPIAVLLSSAALAALAATGASAMPIAPSRFVCAACGRRGADRHSAGLQLQ